MLRAWPFIMLAVVTHMIWYNILKYFINQNHNFAFDFFFNSNHWLSSFSTWSYHNVVFDDLISLILDNKFKWCTGTNNVTFVNVRAHSAEFCTTFIFVTYEALLATEKNRENMWHAAELLFKCVIFKKKIITFWLFFEAERFILMKEIMIMVQ